MSTTQSITAAATSQVQQQNSRQFYPFQQLSPEDFLTLLVAQLTHQDPLQPMDTREMIAQLTQLQSVAQLQRMTSLLEQLTNKPSVSWLGRRVRFIADGQTQEGRVQRLVHTQEGWLLQIGQHLINADQILEVTG